jgi:hypothetical protein
MPRQQTIPSLYGIFPLAWRAHRAVAMAVKRGDLQHVSTLYCVDCGKFAQCYDHRDYEKPLDVEPVCFSCNSRRGPASTYRYTPEAVS